MARRKKQMCEQEGSQAAVETQERLVGTRLGGGVVTGREDWDGQAERAGLNGLGWGEGAGERGLGCGLWGPHFLCSTGKSGLRVNHTEVPQLPHPQSRVLLSSPRRWLSGWLCPGCLWYKFWTEVSWKIPNGPKVGGRKEGRREGRISSRDFY